MDLHRTEIAHSKPLSERPRIEASNIASNDDGPEAAFQSESREVSPLSPIDSQVTAGFKLDEELGPLEAKSSPIMEQSQ